MAQLSTYRWWMKPNGKIIPLNKTHEMWARLYFSNKFEYGDNDERRIVDGMYRDGWIRLIALGDDDNLSLHYEYYYINPSLKTIKSIKDFAIEIGAKKIYDDIKERDYSLNEVTQKDIKARTEHFWVKFGEPDIAKGAAKIFLGNEWFANAVKMLPGWHDKYKNMWYVNRHTGAFRLGYNPKEAKFYKTIQELLNSLENWYNSNINNPVTENEFGDNVDDKGMVKISKIFSGVSDLGRECGERGDFNSPNQGNNFSTMFSIDKDNKCKTNMSPQDFKNWQKDKRKSVKSWNIDEVKSVKNKSILKEIIREVIKEYIKEIKSSKNNE